MQRLIETLPRLRRAHPWLTDLLLIVLVAVPPVIRPQPGWRPVWVQTVVYAALVLPLLWRRRRPVLVAALVTAGFWAQYHGQVWGQEPGRGAVALAAVLATLTVRGRRRAAAATVICAAGCVMLWIPAWQRGYGGPGARGAWLTPLAVGLLLAGAWVFGEYVRARRAYIAEFERRAALAESERLALARVAVAEERARIAREIHDVLAHSVSVMVLNAEGGRLMRHADPTVVDRTLGVISATGRDALDELRRLLEVLRTPRTPHPVTPDAGQIAVGSASPSRPIFGGWSPASTRAARAPDWTLTESVAAFRRISPCRCAASSRRRSPTSPSTHRRTPRSTYGSTRVPSRPRAPRPTAFPRSRTHRHARTDRPVRRQRRRRTHTRRGLPGHRHPAPHRARTHHGDPVTGPTPTASPSRVLICDDQELIRTGLRMVVDSQPDLTVVGGAVDGDAAIVGVAALEPDLVLMDVRMPGLDGLAATEHLCAQPHGPRILVVTTFDLDEYAYAALRAGANGFLVKGAPSEEILVTVRAVLRGEVMVAPSLTRRLVERFVLHAPASAPAQRGRLAALTERDREVLALVARGLANGEIADRLFVGETTVKTHLGRILTKLGLRDRIHAVIFAYESGLIRAGD